MEFVASTLILTGLAAILAVSFNLIIGYAGLMSIAHPAFYALGAYGSAMMSLYLGVPIPLAICLGGLLAGLISLALSLPSLRISGDYLVIASIGFQLSVIQIIKNLDITGGPGGLAGIPPLLPTISIAGSAIVIAVVWLGVLASALLLRWLVGGGYGLSIAAMRDDEAALAGLGRSTMRIKVTLFATACAIAGVAGGIYAHYFQYISPDQFDIAYSAAILTMVVVGGVRTVWGPVLGAVLLQALPQVIRFIDMPSSVLGSVQGLIYTGLVLLFLFVRPGGILGASNELRLSTFSDDDAEQAV